MSLKLHIAALIGMAAELHASGAIRPDHAQKFSALRTGLDQAADQADQADAASVLPAPPGAAEFAALRETVETLALTVDHTGDQVQSLVDLANAPKV